MHSGRNSTSINPSGRFAFPHPSHTNAISSENPGARRTAPDHGLRPISENVVVVRKTRQTPSGGSRLAFAYTNSAPSLLPRLIHRFGRHQHSIRVPPRVLVHVHNGGCDPDKSLQRAQSTFRSCDPSLQRWPFTIVGEQAAGISVLPGVSRPRACRDRSRDLADTAFGGLTNFTRYFFAQAGK
jgi:hypothetical protein